MKSLLAIDIGNTNITAGIFRGDRLCIKGKTPTHGCSRHRSFLKRLCSSASVRPDVVDAAIISSVDPLALSRFLMEMNRIFTCPIRLTGRDVNVPIANRYRIKAEVGQDRLVNAYAARTLYGAPAVIIDFGTAITFDVVSKRGDYLGGLILPGIELSLSSLYRKTALLPRVELEAVTCIIGRDTASSMRGGILFGFGAMCDGLIAAYRDKLGKGLKTIVTGGNAHLMKRYIRSAPLADEDLTLKGLYLVDRSSPRG